MNENFKQLIYYNVSSPKTTAGLTSEGLITGTAFSDYLPLSQLGIQALPGTKFYLNGNENPVIVGFPGVFAIDLSLNGLITSLKFDRASIQDIERNDSAMLIIDMAYLGGLN